MTYSDKYNEIVDMYNGYANDINTQYDNNKNDIQNKPITEDYTIEDQQRELSENEINRKNALNDNETAKQNALTKYDTDYKEYMEAVKNSKSSIDYDYIMKVIEDIDFESPEPLDVDMVNTEKIMTALPATVNNTKYIYLTFDNKYLALNDLAGSEHKKYSDAYDEIESRYIDNPDDPQKEVEIKDLNSKYILTITEIAKALTELKTDKETGFSGDVHIDGKLHVDTDINLEGKINNVSIDDILTKEDKTQLINEIDTKSSVIKFDTMEDMMSGWDSIPDKSIVLTGQGADQWTASFTFKHSAYRSLSFTIPKVEVDYLWTRFQGDNTPWSKPSSWRKIPLLNTSNNLVCNNVKANNETRLQALEKNKSDKTHTHTINEITDYEPYDDSRLWDMIDTKADREHFHSLREIGDYQPYDDSILQLRIQILEDKPEYDDTELKNRIQTLEDKPEYEYDDSDVRTLIDTHTHTSFKDITLNGYTNMKLSVEGSSNSYIWPLRVFDDILENGQNLTVGLGKAQNSAQCAIMYYHQDESNPYFCLGLHSNDIMKLYKDKVEISKPITNMLSIVDNGDATKWSTNISVTKPAMTDGNCLQIYIGKEISAKKSGYLGYLHSDTDPKMTIGLNYADHLLTIGENAVNIKPALTCVKTITATNVKEDNETRLKAVETNKSDKTHTHNISDIEDYQPYDDSEVRTLINTKTDKEYVDMWVDKLTADDYSSYTQINDLSERVRTVENRVFDKLQDRYKYKVNNIPSNFESYLVYYGPEYTFLSNDTGTIVSRQSSAYYTKNTDGSLYNQFTIDNYSYNLDIPRIQIRNQSGDIILDISDLLQRKYLNGYTDPDNIPFHMRMCYIPFDTIPVFEGYSGDKFYICVERTNDLLTPQSQFYQTLQLHTTIVENITSTIPEDNKLLTFSVMRDLLYPVGSIYTSMNTINPSTLLGGAWVQIDNLYNSSMTVYAWVRYE